MADDEDSGGRSEDEKQEAIKSTFEYNKKEPKQLEAVKIYQK